MIYLPEYVTKAMKALNDSGYECYVVGGAIRSAILNMPVHDYDLTTDALPSQMKEVFHNWRTFDTGIQHGTITVLSDHQPLEITTYRKDSTYQDHRHPDAVQFTSSIEEDCSRRDFTVNAFCYSEEHGFLDFFHGMDDIRNKLIRCIGDPYRRFDEDALRILRAIRFAAQLNFTIEENTARAILELKDTLSYVSMERINEEFTKYLSSSGCASLFISYLSVFTVFLRELSFLSEDEKRTLTKRLSFSSDRMPVRMAILLSSACFDNPRSILKRMKFSNNEIKEISQLISFQDKPVETLTDIRKLKKDLTVPFEEFIAFKEGMSQHRYNEACEYNKQIENNNLCCTLKQLAVNGNDLVQLGIRGKAISETLNMLLDKVISDEIPNDKEILLSQIKS